jgi:YNFM family putative membrane transporter
MVMTVMTAGLLVTLFDSVVAVVAGTGLFTFGFFASHSVASSWVGRRARAPQALASAMYLFSYYLGSSVVGWGSGYVYARAGWTGEVAMLGAILMLALLAALRLRSIAPVGPLEAKP